MSAEPSNVHELQQPWLLSHEPETAFRMRVAREAQRAWARLSLRDRARLLDRIGDLLVERRDELVKVISEENGKARVEALGHEVAASVDAVRFATGEGQRILADERVNPTWLPHRAPVVRRQPHGVIVVISPWNFPLSIPLGQVVFALMAGNAVILKPSEWTPRCGQLVGELCAAAGLPANLVQIVQGDGAVGAALIEARPDKVAFTGSVATGRKVMAAASRFPIPVTLELGGIDAMIVCADADLEVATSAAVWGAFMNHGQVCASVERILVEETVRERFVGRMLQKIEALDKDNTGRVTMPRQSDVWERQVAEAKKRGLQFLCGGDWHGDGKYHPTVVAGEGIAGSEIWKDESFGPLVALDTFRDDADAIRKHNDTDYGLTASVFTSDPTRAERLCDALEVGLVSVNEVAASLHAFAALPWGGKGGSGFGRSHGAEGLLDMTWPKVIDRPRRVLGRDLMEGVKRPWWYPYDPDQTKLIDAFTVVIGDRRFGPRVRATVDAAKALLGGLRRAPRL
jgi:acyl-CoA reductase-like NAD-dependent aldehyde dehydrogenase